MNLRLSHIAKIIFALCLAAGLLAITAEAGQAESGGSGCTSDGRPYVWISGATPGAVFPVYANGQNVGSVTIGVDGQGSLAFGQPGVNYALELDIGPDRMPAGNINCPPPSGGGQTGQTIPQLTTIELSPDSVTMRVNEQRTFTATGRDQYGKDYTLSSVQWTTSGGGTLSNCSGNTCTYTATQAGDYTLVVQQSGTTIQGTAKIHTADPPVLTTIELSPDSVTMRVNEQRTFTATGKDQYGKPYTLSNLRWTTSGGGTLSNCSGTTCTYTATQPGDFTLVVQQSGTTIQGTAKIHTADPPVLTTIELSPDSVTMRVNEQRTFTATGRDQYGNPYTLSNPTWTTSGGWTLSPNGASASYTATQAGDFTITAGEAGTTIQGTATIQVKPTETSALPWIIGGVLALGIAAGAAYWLWGRPKVRLV